MELVLSSYKSDRHLVIDRVVLVEHQVTLYLAETLNIDSDNAESLKGLTFNAKVLLLIDTRELLVEERKIFQKLMEIRNVFAHQYKVDTFEKLFTFNGEIKKWWNKTYPSENIRVSFDSLYSEAIKILLRRREAIKQIGEIKKNLEVATNTQLHLLKELHNLIDKTISNRDLNDLEVSYLKLLEDFNSEMTSLGFGQ